MSYCKNLMTGLMLVLAIQCDAVVISKPSPRLSRGWETMSLNGAQRAVYKEYEGYYNRFMKLVEELSAICDKAPRNESAKSLVAELNEFSKRPCWRQFYSGNPNYVDFSRSILRSELSSLERKVDLLAQSVTVDRSIDNPSNKKVLPTTRSRYKFGDPHDKLDKTGKDGWPENLKIADAPRKWTDAKGREIEAVWYHVSEDGKTIWVLRVKDGKYLKVLLENLSRADREYVQGEVRRFREDGFTWFRGVYLSKDAWRENRYFYKALNLIDEKTIAGEWDLEVVQVIGFGALCKFGEFKDGRLVQSGENFVFWEAGTAGLLAVGEVMRGRKMYWAGTRTYQTVGGNENTVSCVTDDLGHAIRCVRIRMSLYDKGDARFDLDVKSGGEDEASSSESQPPQHAKPGLVATGSGFFVTSDGYLLTNHHVISGGNKYFIRTSAGRVEARLIRADVETDLALLKAEGTYHACKFSSKRKEKLGAPVFTLGFPQPGVQGFSPKVTKGIISGDEGFRGDVREYQVDASVQPGNSGGPLFDSEGNVVGVIVASLQGGQVVNYAIKKSYVLAFLDATSQCAEGLHESVGTVKDDSLERVIDSVRDGCALVESHKE